MTDKTATVALVAHANSSACQTQNVTSSKKNVKPTVRKSDSLKMKKETKRLGAYMCVWCILQSIVLGLGIWFLILGLKYYQVFSQEDPSLLQTTFKDTYQLCDISKHNISLNSFSVVVLGFTCCQMVLFAAYIISSIYESFAPDLARFTAMKHEKDVTHIKQHMPYYTSVFCTAALVVNFVFGSWLLSYATTEAKWFDNKPYQSFYSHHCNMLLLVNGLTGLAITVQYIYDACVPSRFGKDECSNYGIYVFCKSVLVLASYATYILICFTCYWPVSQFNSNHYWSIGNPPAFLAAVSVDAFDSHAGNFVDKHYTGCEWVDDDQQYGSGLDYKSATFDTVFHNDSMTVDLYCEYYVKNRTTLKCFLKKYDIYDSPAVNMGSFTLTYPQCKCVDCERNEYNDLDKSTFSSATFESYHFIANMTVCFDSIFYDE